VGLAGRGLPVRQPAAAKAPAELPGGQPDHTGQIVLAAVVAVVLFGVGAVLLIARRRRA
jgi:hypothetical protein